ncbi:unnamed protein product [Vicia faba]|uniref:Pectin acetylesterase n=1 Tax=Vicia faba TaxID=3906 RepID=A0AAV1A7G2_VICFA|nr:unnamed protein product [Vicia faba]
MVKLFWVSIVIALVFIKLVDAYHINETELSILEAHEGYSFSSNLVNQPRMVGITFIQSAAAKGAVCLDGTLPAYHFDRGYGSGANSWIVNLEGGAWCNNVRTCVYRKTTRRGSSNFMEKAIPFTGIMSNNPRENPDFFNWNRVKIRYCDGASFTGDSENRVIPGNLILNMLLHHLSPNSFHMGRTLLHHTIICNNERALNVLLNNGVDTELALQTTEEETNLYPIHMAARLGLCNILQCLINGNCNLDSQTKLGDTALMVCTRYKHEKCLRVLVSSGADLGIVNSFGHCATSTTTSIHWTKEYQKAVLDIIRARKVVKSSNASRFSSLLFVTHANDIEALKKVVENRNINLNEQNESGFSAVMISASEGSVKAFKLLLHAGADVTNLKNKDGLTALDIIDLKQNGEDGHKVMFEYALKKGCLNISTLAEANTLHRAACYGDINMVEKLLKEGNYDVNGFDENGYTPLMLAARESNGEMCGLLISHGAKCDIKNERHETALLLARENFLKGNDAENVIMDELARRVVLCGARVKKHTKCGKGLS